MVALEVTARNLAASGFRQTFLILLTFCFFSASVLFAASQDNDRQQENPLVTQTKQVQQTVEIVNRLSADASLGDEALVGASVKYQNAITKARDLIRSIDEQSTEINNRLEEIGGPPEDNTAPEPDAITSTRARLNAEKSALAVAKTDLEEAISAANLSLEEIAVRRQELFAEALTKRTRIDFNLLSRARDGVFYEFSNATQLVSNWVSFVLREKFWQALGSAMMALALAVFLSFNFNRFFGRHLERGETDPDYFKRVFTAYWATLLPSLATAIFLGASYALFRQFELLSSKIGALLFTLFLVIAGLVFAWNFCRAVFSPRSWNWRLIRISNHAAKQMFWLTFLLFAVYALDYFMDSVDSILSTSLSITVVQGAFASIIIGLILIAMALIKPVGHGTEETPPSILHHGDNWARWISIPLIVMGSILILSSIAGYIGLARFLAQQIVVTGAIIAIVFIGIIAARELGKEGVMANTAVGRFMLSRGYEPYQIEQASLIASGLFIFFILAIGIPLILMQWGTRFEEITTFIARAFAGFDIAGFRISLSGILIGLAIFAVIILLTRLFQGWLTRSIFPRSRIDPGVSNSIRAGVGYIGFAIAGLVAVTSAGLDLSSLAIVAGALSLGIGFGLQNIVNNFVSGLILLVERPIKVGDWIIVGSAEGTVKRISVRATEIETFKRQSIIIPNSELINSQVTNWTLKSKAGRVDIPIGISYGADAKLAEKILYEIGHYHAMVARTPEPNVWFTGFGDSSLDFLLRVFLNDIGNVVTVETEIRFEILRRFAEAGIEIPFPQRDLHLRMENGGVSLPGAWQSSASDQEKSKTPLSENTPKAKRRRRTKGTTDMPDSD